MAKKLTVAVLVLFALLYSMIVPSPSDYEYDITKGLGPQALYYYKLVGGKNGAYYQVNNLLFDTGQVYPPPRKPTISPQKRKRKKRKRKSLPSRVERILPNVMMQQVKAVEKRAPQKAIPREHKLIEMDKHFNKQNQRQRHAAFRNNENNKGSMHGTFAVRERDGNKNIRKISRDVDVEGNGALKSMPKVEGEWTLTHAFSF